MKRRGGDRRGRIRFEVLGDLLGALQASTILYIRDISLGGALLESTVPLAQGQVHRVTTVGEGTPMELNVRVARQTQVHGHLYLIGVEFVDLAAETVERIRMWIERDYGSPGEASSN